MHLASLAALAMRLLFLRSRAGLQQLLEYATSYGLFRFCRSPEFPLYLFVDLLSWG